MTTVNRKAYRLRAWLGTNGPALDDPPQERADALALAYDLGQWVRLDLDWPGILNPDRHARQVELVADAARIGLRVLAVIGYRPDAVEAIDPDAPDRNHWQLTPTGQGATEIRRCVPQIEALIRAGVSAVEGWNEWNAAGFAHPPDAAAMAVYHAALCDAVTQAGWRAGRFVPTIVGGTAPDAYWAHRAYEDMLGVTDVVPAIGEPGMFPAHHPYAFGPGYDPHAAEHVGEGYNALRFQAPAIYLGWVASGRLPARVWATEIGWPDSLGPDEQARRASVDLAWWADLIRQGIGGPIFVYTARSDRYTGVDGERFGLRDEAGRRKAALVSAVRKAGSLPLAPTFGPLDGDPVEMIVSGS